MPIRDKATHEPLKGVTIGDCGYKNGNNLIDNGYLLFDHVRIPKDYGLNKISGVDQEGKFVTQLENPEKRFALYMGPLSAGRAFVCANSITASTSALAIALRYCNTRKQFSKDMNSAEELLINYPLTKNRLIPRLAQNLVYYFGGIHILYLYDSNLKHFLEKKNKAVE